MKFSKDLKCQLEMAKSTMIGKQFRNIKTGNKYCVKGIAIDSETLELRVIYNDIKNPMNDWDRPMALFIQKFTDENWRYTHE